MGKHRDWTEIQREYEETRISYAKLAEKHNIPIATLKQAAARFGWKKGVKEIVKKAEEQIGAAEETIPLETIPAETIPDKTIPKQLTPVIELYPENVRPAETDAERFNRIVNEMMNRVEDAICNMDVTNAGAVKLLTGALRDLRKLKHLDKTPLDIEEQKARIEKLRSEAAIREINTEPVVVQFINMDGAEE